MRYEKKRFFRKCRMVVTVVAAVMFAAGCGQAVSGQKRIAEICNDFYKKEGEELKQENGLEEVQHLVNVLGESGYPAVDNRNQTDMAGAQEVLAFCEKKEAGEKAALAIAEVGYGNDFAVYELDTEGGEVDVTRSYYKYENGRAEKKSEGVYRAEVWKYTEEGYLIFSGAWDSLQQRVLTMSETEEHAALRVQPLEERYREWNREYLLPVGYEQNNLFLTDWNGEDFGEIDFYDVYDIFYPLIYGEEVPYTADENLGKGAVYRIPKEEFERVVMRFFDIDSETLREKTIYHAEDQTYEYRPRGLYEVEYPEYPYPEVTGASQNDDGTITLTVQAVFPYEDDSRVLVHEVTVRPEKDGGVKYISNKRIFPEEGVDVSWHVPRLTEEEWKSVYEGND